MKRIYFAIFLYIIAIHGYAQLNQGYTDKLSYRAGETVTFYLDAGCSSGCTLNLELEDIHGNNIYSIGNIDVPANQGTTNVNPWEDGFGFIQSSIQWINIPATIQSGYYMIDDLNNPNTADPNKRIPIIIKGDNSNSSITGADIVIVCPTNTINAYTSSGGYSLYQVNPANTTVSFRRPQNRAQYGNCDDAFLDWIRTWGPAYGYKLNFISDADLDDSPTHIGWDEIKNAKLLIISGHSEYWTRQARLNFDKFVDGDIANGIPAKNALILSGNTMWCQVRYEDEISPYPADLTKLTCYRGANWCTPTNVSGSCYDMDVTTDPLLATYPWMSTDLKYSALGSIGSDILRGGQSNFTYNGQKIIKPASPLLNVNGVPITLPNVNGVSNNPYIPNSFSNTEYDGTLVQCDANGNAVLVSGEPVLDLAALGFYQGEIIGYEFGTPDANPTNHLQFNDPNPYNNNQHYFPFMVFKKTFTSGTVVNVNSNRWCEDDLPPNPNFGWSGSTPVRANITANIINLMITDYNGQKNGELLFTNVVPGSNNPGPVFIAVKPAYTTVNYSACSDGGNIHFTPYGIYLNQAYKVDNGFTSNPDHTYQSVNQQTRYIDDENIFAAAYFDANCSTYHPLRIAHHVKNENNGNDNNQYTDLNFSLFPNPATDKFNLQMLSSNNSEKNIYIYNSINQEIFHKEKFSDENLVIDLSSATKGIYFVKVIEGDKAGVKKIVLM